MQTCRSASVWVANTIQTSLFVLPTPAVSRAPRQRSGPAGPSPRLAEPRSLARLWSPRGIQGATRGGGLLGAQRSEAPLPSAPEHAGTKGLSRPSPRKGLRSSQSEVQPPAAVI